MESMESTKSAANVNDEWHFKHRAIFKYYIIHAVHSTIWYAENIDERLTLFMNVYYLRNIRDFFNPSSAILFYLKFHPLEVVATASHNFKWVEITHILLWCS